MNAARAGMAWVFRGGALWLLACGGDRPAPVPDSIPGASSIDSAARAAEPSSWVADLGAMLIVPAESPDAGVVLVPESPDAELTASAPFTLLSSAGSAVTTPAALVVSDSQVCGVAPLVRLRDSLAGGWNVGLSGRTITPIPMDSIQGLPQADSLTLAVELARLASTLPMHADSRFKGLPFAVLSARRFEIPGRSVVAAHLVRRLPQEAAPVEEHTFLVAERSSASASRDSYEISYSARSEGSEETVEQYEILSAIQARGPWILMTRERLSQTAYQLLERVGDAWRPRWSRVLSC